MRRLAMGLGLILGVSSWAESAWAADGQEDPWAVLLDRANASMRRREYDNAILDLDEYLRDYKGDERVFNLRGSAWHMKGDDVKAIADYTEAIHLDPAYVAALDNRAMSFSATGDHDRALADCNEAVRLSPMSPKVFFRRGCCRAVKKSYDEAIADYDVAIGLDPKFVEAYTDRAECLWRLTKINRAMADFDQAIRLDPFHASAYLYRGRAWHSQKAYDKASDDYQEALRLAPNESRTLQALAWLWATCPDAAYRDGERAIDAATRASDLERGKNPHALSVLAAAFAEHGEFEEAVGCQEKAINMLKSNENREKYQKYLKQYIKRSPCRD